MYTPCSARWFGLDRVHSVGTPNDAYPLLETVGGRQGPRTFEPRPSIHERRRSAVSKRYNQCLKSAYDNVWRWSGGDWRIGRARKDQGTRGMGQPAGLKRHFDTARGEALSQAVLSAPIRLGEATAAGHHGGRRIRDLVEWSLQASVEAPAP